MVLLKFLIIYCYVKIIYFIFSAGTNLFKKQIVAAAYDAKDQEKSQLNLAAQMQYLTSTLTELINDRKNDADRSSQMKAVEFGWPLTSIEQFKDWNRKCLKKESFKTDAVGYLYRIFFFAYQVKVLFSQDFRTSVNRRCEWRRCCEKDDAKTIRH